MSITKQIRCHGRHARSATVSLRLTPVGLALCAVWAGHVHAQQAPDNADAAVRTLPTIAVTETADATTEDSGSYMARSATIAGRVPVPVRETPASVSVLTRERIDDQNMTTIQEALRYVTGVTSVDYGDGTAYFRARGSQLGVEFDGVPLVSGLQYQQQFDLAMYDRIEVLRGPAGVMAGFGEPGGTVNLVRKRAQDQFHVATETQVGSFGSVRQMVDVTGPLNKEGTIRGRAVIVGSDALQSVDKTRDKEVMLYGALDFDLTPRTTLSLSAAYQVNPISALDYGAPGVTDSDGNLIGRVPGSYTQNFSPSWNSAYTSIEEGNANLVHKFENGWQSNTTLFYRHELLNSSYAYAGPGADSDNNAYFADQRQRNTYDWFGADTNISGPIQLFGQTHTLTVGANYSLMSDTERTAAIWSGQYFDLPYNLFDANSVPAVNVPFSTDADMVSGANNRTVQYGFYAQARIHLAKPLTLVLGGREAFLQQQSQTILPTVSDWTTEAQLNHRFLPSAGLVWNVTPWLTAYASYAKFITAQTETTYLNTGLPPRTGEQYEAGVKASFFGGRMAATAAAFHINDNNRAITDPSHATGSIPGGRARDEGFELEVSGQPLQDWNVYAGYTYLNEQFENDVPDLTDGTDPKHLFKLWTNYKFSQGLLKNVSIGGGMLAQTQISRGVTQGGYAIFNAQIGYRFNKHVEAALQFNNIFNRDYYIRPPGNFFSVFGDKRNVMLTVRSDF